MQIIKNFSVFKNKEQKSEKSPTHSLSTKIGEEFVNIGSGWTKDTKGGDKFVSVQMSKPFQDKKGFVIVIEDELKALYKECGRDWDHEHGNDR